MSAAIDGGGLVSEAEGLIDDCQAEAVEELITGGERAEEQRVHTPLPWIGALPNPRLGPMVVVSDGGYFVPLFTAVDLVRGCRYFWRRALE